MEKMKTLLMSICLLLVSTVSFAQVEEASGNVTDNSGEPVIGATVTVVGGGKEMQVLLLILMVTLRCRFSPVQNFLSLLWGIRLRW